jgi:MFS family permease
VSRISGLVSKPTYGWVIVVIAALAMVATLPGRTHGLGMITERLLADERFHLARASGAAADKDEETPAHDQSEKKTADARFQLDRVTYSNINLWATLLGGLFCLPCGWLIDRFGLRLTLTTTVAALAATVLWMTHIDDLYTLSLAICLTRGFGQSALSVISITMVGKWFRDRQIWPMAVYTFLLSAGFAMSMGLAKPYAEADWRVVWNGIGYALLSFIPVAAILTRDPQPLPVTASEDGGIPVAAQTGFTVKQAMRTQAFWVFGIAISLIALIGAGTSLFNQSVLAQQGFPPQTLYDLAILTFMVGMVVKLPIGLIGLWVPLNRLLTAGLVLLAICMAFLPYVHTQFGITLYGVGMAVSGTITTVLFFTIWGQAYGKVHLGQIQSIAQMMTVLASALGPRLFAECFERYGTYTGVFQVLAVVAAAIAAWSWLIRVPRPEEAPLGESLVVAPVVIQTAFQEASS